MELQEIEVFIEKDGRVSVKVGGIKGMACCNLTAAMEQALGGQVESREMLPEAYETVQESVQDQQHLKGSGPG